MDGSRQKSLSDGVWSEELDRFDPSRYALSSVLEDDDRSAYEALMRNAYEPLGFMSPTVLPTERSDCFQIRYNGKLIAVFRLTPVEDPASAYFPLLPIGLRPRSNVRLLEVNNVVVDQDFRATIVLGLILVHSATIAVASGYDFVVGITRYQTLRYFVDFGVIPVDHEPLHLLGRPDILDFVIYYDVQTIESRDYIHQRARRYFHQQQVMRSIQLKHGSRPRRSALEGSRSPIAAAPLEAA